MSLPHKNGVRIDGR